LQSEAANAKKASETAIPGVLRMRPAPIDSVLGLVRFSSAAAPPFRQQKPEILQRLCLSALIEAVRDQIRAVELKQVNRVLIQPHWRNDCDQLLP